MHGPTVNWNNSDELVTHTINPKLWPKMQNFGISQRFYKLDIWCNWCLAMPTKINSINLQGNVMFICMQKFNFIPSFFFFLILQRYHKLAILGNLGHAWLWSVETVLSACRKLWRVSSCKKYLFFTSSLKYYRDNAILLFCLIWLCLTTPTKSDSSNL